MEADITAVSVIITIATITIPLWAGSRQLLLPSRGTAAGATHKQRGLKIKIFLNIDIKNIPNFLLTQQNCSAQKVNFETDKTEETTSQSHLGFCLQEANCQSTFSGPGQRRSSREHLGHAWDWCSG